MVVTSGVTEKKPKVTGHFVPKRTMVFRSFERDFYIYDIKT